LALDINQFNLQVLKIPHRFFTNQELLILKNIIPTPFKAALVFNKNYELIQIIENGNYAIHPQE